MKYKYLFLILLLFITPVYANTIDNINIDIYIDINGNGTITETWEAFTDEGTELYDSWKECLENIEKYYMAMSEAGAKPDQLRMILPHSTAAEYTMTCNIREWRHILSLRCAKMTHPAIRQILIPLLLNFKEDMPELFDEIGYDEDMPKEKYAKLEIM